MDWKSYIQSIAKAAALLLNPSCICTNLPFGHVWSTVPIFGVVLQVPHGLDLLDRVQKLVVSLVGSGLPYDLQALSHKGMLLASACSGKCS